MKNRRLNKRSSLVKSLNDTFKSYKKNSNAFSSLETDLMPSLSTSGRRTHFFFDTIMNEGDVDVVVVDAVVVVVDE